MRKGADTCAHSRATAIAITRTTYQSLPTASTRANAEQRRAYAKVRVGTPVCTRNNKITDTNNMRDHTKCLNPRADKPKPRSHIHTRLLCRVLSMQLSMASPWRMVCSERERITKLVSSQACGTCNKAEFNGRRRRLCNLQFIIACADSGNTQEDYMHAIHIRKQTPCWPRNHLHATMTP